RQNNTDLLVYRASSQPFYGSNRCRVRTGNFHTPWQLALNITELPSPLSQHLDCDVTPTAEYNDDFAVLSKLLAQNFLQSLLTLIAQGDIDAAGHLHHDLLVIGKPPATHRSFGIGQDKAPNVAPFAEFESLFS